MSQPHDDAYYVDCVLRGDSEAFRELVQRYQGLVYRIAYSMIGNAEGTQDVVQEVFYRVFRRLHQYRLDCPFGAWIRRITVNHILDLRKKREIRAVSLTQEKADDFDVPDSRNDPRDEIRRAEQHQTVLKALDRLPDKDRTILLLRHFENLSYEEIAEILAIPIGTVMTNLHRARKKISELLKPLQAELLI